MYARVARREGADADAMRRTADSEASSVAVDVRV
jgi:hypothetical protein